MVLPFVWITPSLQDLFYLLITGVLGGAAQFGFIHAFRIAPISSLAPFDYCGLVWAILAGFFIWGDVPDVPTILGGALIISMGLVTLYRENKKAP